MCSIIPSMKKKCDLLNLRLKKPCDGSLWITKYSCNEWVRRMCKRCFSHLFCFFLEENRPIKAAEQEGKYKPDSVCWGTSPSLNTPTNKATSCFDFTEACVPGLMNQHTKVGVDYNEICDDIHACVPHNAVFCVICSLSVQGFRTREKSIHLLIQHVELLSVL